MSRSDIQKGRGEILSLKQHTWVENWPAQYTNGPITATVACTDDAIFVASQDGGVTRFNADRGWWDWRFRTPGVLVDAPVLLSDRLVQIIPGVGTWVFHRKKVDNQVMWKDPARLQYLGQAQDRMFFFDGANLVCKNPQTGKTRGAVPVRNARNVLAVPNPDGTRLYLVETNGDILCANDLGQPYLVISQDGKTVTTQPAGR